MKLLVTHLFRQLPVFTILMVFIAIIALFSFVLPLSFSILIETTLPHYKVNEFTLLMIAAFCLIALRMFLQVTQDYLFLFIRNIVEKRVSQDFLKASILNKNTENNAASLTSTLTVWLSNFQYFLSEFLFYCGYALVVSFAVFIVLFWVAPPLASIALIFLVGHWVNYQFHYPITKRFSKEYNAKRSAFSQFVSTTLAAKKMVNVFQVEKQLQQQLNNSLHQMYGQFTHRENAANAQEFVQNILKSGLFIAFVVAGTHAIFTSNSSIGEILLCLLLIGFAYQPIYRLNEVAKSFGEAATQMSELALRSQMQSVSLSELQPAPIRRLTLCDLTISLGERPLFQPLNFTFIAGKIYLIEAPSGQGKSSLLKVLAGLQMNATGKMFVARDNEPSDIQSLQPEDVSWMPQKSLFLPGSVRENITLFDSTYDEAQYLKARRIAEVNFIEDTARLDATAKNLSGGQAQRLNLARALYPQHHVLLLDEPTASLDAATEQRVLTTLAAEKHNRIIIMISHNQAARKYCDEILTLSESGLYPMYGRKQA